MFKYENYPMLEKHHLEHEKLLHVFSKFVDSEADRTEAFNKKSDEAWAKLNRFDHEVYAKEIYNIFSKLKPVLRKTTGGVIKWAKIYGKLFEELTDSDKNVLIGLLEE